LLVSKHDYKTSDILDVRSGGSTCSSGEYYFYMAQFTRCLNRAYSWVALNSRNKQPFDIYTALTNALS